MEKLQQRLKDLQEALKNNGISVNEYCSMYYATWEDIKKLKKLQN